MQVIGNLTRDAIVNNVSGKSVINFSVAHNEKYKNSNGEIVDKSVFVDCAYWTDKTAIAPYLKKGTQVYVEGQPEASKYDTKDGSVGVKLTLRVSSVQLLGSKSDAPNSQPTQAASNPQSQVYDTSDILPF